jgi:hypothetical protein
MVLTDGVSHACIEGQHALVDTFIVPLRNCRFETPYQLLQGELLQGAGGAPAASAAEGRRSAPDAGQGSARGAP